jgi:hypothetical protein
VNVLENGTYAHQSRALDNAIAVAIAGWQRGEDVLAGEAFDDLALALFEYQLAYNQPYARYCERSGITRRTLPRSWEAIPPVPAAAFKDSVLATFDSTRAALAFATSGTTVARSGRHYLETAELYEAASTTAFERCMLPDGARLRYLNLVSDPSERPESSLGYMMQCVGDAFGAGETGWFVHGDILDHDAFESALRQAQDSGKPVCIASTAFALVHVLDRLEAKGIAFDLPSGSRVMETGGFKGRSRTIERAELYPRLSRRFGLPFEAIIAEYGMTELCSQYYDDVLIRPSRAKIAARRKVSPPWLRTRVVGPDGKTLPAGTVGALVHVDLANRSSCIAIATEDLGVRFDSGDDAGLVLMGREAGAPLRGCSLDAETLLAR